MSARFARPERALDCAWCCEGRIPAAESDLCGGVGCLEWPKGFINDAYARDWLIEQHQVVATAAKIQGWPTDKYGNFLPKCSCGGDKFDVEYRITGTMRDTNADLSMDPDDGSINGLDTDGIVDEFADVEVDDITCQKCRKRYTEYSFKDDCFPDKSAIAA